MNNVESIQCTFLFPALTMNIDISKIGGVVGMDNLCVLYLYGLHHKLQHGDKALGCPLTVEFRTNYTG